MARRLCGHRAGKAPLSDLSSRLGQLCDPAIFAAQAILPSLVRAYNTTPAMMGFAVNASTIGMAIAGVVVALISRYLNRRHGIWISLAMLAIPTTLLASAPDITGFMLLRVAQGLCMSTAFTLTMAYLAERSMPSYSERSGRLYHGQRRQ